MPVVAISIGQHPEDASAATRAGARAVVLQRCGVKDLMAAMRTVAAGQLWLPREVQGYLTAAPRAGPEARLTMREREIIRNVALGLHNAEVARALFISEVTVKTHINNIFRKLALRDRVELALFALRTGLITLDEYQTRASAASYG